MSIQVASPGRYLSEDDVAAFERDGYVVRRGLFTPEEAARIAAWTDEVQHLPEVPGKYMMYFERSLLEPGRRVIQRIENFSPYHAGFARLFESPQMCGAVAQLFGEPAVLFKEKINLSCRAATASSPTRISRQAGAATRICSSPRW